MKSTKLKNDIFISPLIGFYAFDGLDNNQINPNYGAFSINLDIPTLDYSDQISSPSRSNHLKSRVITNTLTKQNRVISSDRRLTDLIGFHDHNFFSESPRDDFFLNYEGKNILAPGLGTDFYQLSLDVAESEMLEKDGVNNQFSKNRINNALSLEIGDYFVANSNVSSDTSKLHRFFRQDIGSHFYTTFVEQQAVINDLHQYIYEKIAHKSPTIKNDSFASGLTNFYSIDGLDNNLIHPNYGSVGSNLVSTAPLDYGDRIASPAGADRPNSRVISNTLAQQDQAIPSDRGLTNFIWAFGQFLDHDIVLTPENPHTEVHISVPVGDQFLDPYNTGRVTIPLDATAFTEGTGSGTDNPAEIANNITAWIDGSNIYGSDRERNNYLREFTGGLLKVSKGNLLPFGTESLENANPSRQNPFHLFAAGDIRANENSVLVAMHTLFVREHNRIAGELARAHPKWSDEQLYERARQINIAQYQSIVYNEYLPAILGVKTLPEYSGYDPTINPNIDRSFSSAAFRIGHTQLSSEILRLDTEGKEIPEGSLTLSEVFFGSTEVVQESGIDPILRGIGSSLSQKVDLKLIDDVRNLLFTFGPHTSGRDLFAINVERGRLNGISDYNTVRHAYGLRKVDGFDEITSDVEIQAQLESLYPSSVTLRKLVSFLNSITLIY